MVIVVLMMLVEVQTHFTRCHQGMFLSCNIYKLLVVKVFNG